MAGWDTVVRDPRFLLCGMSIGAASIVYAMVGFMYSARDSAEIKPAKPKTQYITQETEDSLEDKTLDTLLGHPNFAIRETACKIVCDRVVNDSRMLLSLLRGITNEDYDERLKHLRALALVTDQNSLPLLNTWEAYSALVRSLELGLDPEQEVLSDWAWDDWPMRDITEKLGLMFVCQLIYRYDPVMLVEARFVERWLARQNWGVDRDERLRNFENYRHNRIGDIVTRLKECRAGRAALRRAGLVPTEAIIYMDSASPLLGTDEQGPNGDMQGAAGPAVAGSRFVEQSAAEQRLRHRHREAMVLNDGTRPINSGDIIQRELPPSPR